MSASNFILGLFLALSLGSSTATTLFPCGVAPPCADDPSFLIFGLFTCETAPFDPCDEPDGLAACGLTCLSCPICEVPVVPSSVSAVFQAVEVIPDVVSVFVKNVDPVSGIQGQVGCRVNGEIQAVELVPAPENIGLNLEQIVELDIGIQGKFLVLANTLVTPTYAQVAVLEVDSLSKASCDPGSIGLFNVLISSPEGVLINSCGALDSPCEVIEVAQSPPPSPPSPPSPSPPFPPPPFVCECPADIGDVNVDGLVTVLDLVEIVSSIVNGI